jgi:hypothetical protein
MSGNATRELEARLLRPAGPERFGPAELDGLPGPVARHLAQAIAPGTPLHTSARLAQRGQIKVGRWLPFRARQVLSPGQRFVWTARARLDEAGRIASLAFDRRGDPDGTGRFGWHRFGGRITGYASFGGLAIPAQDRLGWDGGGFFRYRITGLEPSR